MSKKNWVIARVAPASTLAFSTSMSWSMRRALRVDVRIEADADLEVGAIGADAGGQLGGVAVAVGARACRRRRSGPADRRAGPRCGGCRRPSSRWITSSTSSRAGLDAGQVRGGLQGRLLQHPQHGAVGAVAGRAAGAIGHRDEGRVQRLQPADRLPQALLGLRRLGRRELEGDARARGAPPTPARATGPRRPWPTSVCGAHAALLWRSRPRSAVQILTVRPLASVGRQGA